ncbi:MAG: hypothetical protein ABUK14_03240 [Desulfobacteria bacterium]
MPETEKRDSERYGLEFPVQAMWKDALGSVKEERATANDMSRSGMYMICNSPVHEGCQINLEIDLTICAGAGIKSCVSVKGRVVRSTRLTGPDRGYGHAIIFDQYRFLKS